MAYMTPPLNSNALFYSEFLAIHNSLLCPTTVLFFEAHSCHPFKLEMKKLYNFIKLKFFKLFICSDTDIRIFSREKFMLQKSFIKKKLKKVLFKKNSFHRFKKSLKCTLALHKNLSLQRNNLLRSY